MSRQDGSRRAGGIARRLALGGVLAVLLLGPSAVGLGQVGMPMGQVFELRSSDLEPGGMMPRRFTCDGPDLSPPLSWSAPPAGAKSLALIMEDPDAPAGTWVHWVLFNLSPGARTVAAGIPARATLPDGARQGRNDFQRLGYGGPCPPRGPAHRYVFTLFALDAVLDAESGSTKRQIEAAMQGHILARAELVSRYGR